MPELPEVQTTLAGISPYLVGQKIKGVTVRVPKLRWPIPHNLAALLKDATIASIARRAKYLLFSTQKGTLIVHLGMSGRLQILKAFVPTEKHDHVDITLKNGTVMRYTDPRRFGAFLWTVNHPLSHPLLKALGPEPLQKSFNGQYLWQRATSKKISVKVFIMDSKVVVGVGNIYAAESLFDAKINPNRPAQSLSLDDCARLCVSIKKVLRAAIKKGGTTLKDFLGSDGSKGYFSLKLKVYGRGNLPCVTCFEALTESRLGQRSTAYCQHCQV